MAMRTQDLRTFALIGQGHSGKSAFLDAIAAALGAPRPEAEPEEKERKHTLVSHVHRLQRGDVVLQVVDTPGHPDFVAEAVAGLHAADVAVLCVAATEPVHHHARWLWARAGDLGLARAIVVTHLDHDNASFEAKVEELREVLGHEAAPVSFPVAAGHGFQAVGSVLTQHGDAVDRWHEWIEEDEAEVDDALMERYLVSGHIDGEDFVKNLGRAMALGRLAPIFAVSPTTGAGVLAFLDYVVEHFPSPALCKPRTAKRPDDGGAPESIVPSADAPFLGQVFKVVVDPYAGRLSYVRCLRGRLLADQQVVEAQTGRVHKLGHLLSPNGKDAAAAPSVGPGEIFVVPKVEDLHLGATLAAETDPLVLPLPAFPEPSYGLHVWPERREDEPKLAPALEKLCAEDGTLRCRRHAETGELIVEGMSPMHLDVQFQRMHRRQRVAILHAPPSIPYRETALRAEQARHRHKKQTGGRGQFAEVAVRIEPLPPGSGFEFKDAVVGGAVPRQFIPEVEKGARKFLRHGGLAGFPVVDVRVELFDGKAHDVDSDPLSFQIAAERACEDCFLAAAPALLEPIVEVEVLAPERCTGDVVSSLAALRGHVTGMESEHGMQRIWARVPQGTMQDYSIQLRSLTAGEGSFVVRPGGYEPAPPPVQAEVVRHRREALATARRS